AHAMSEFSHPPMQRRITEETEEDEDEAEASSEEAEDARQMQVVENSPFARGRSLGRGLPNNEPASPVHATTTSTTPSPRKRFPFRHARRPSGSVSGSSVSIPNAYPQI